MKNFLYSLILVFFLVSPLAAGASDPTNLKQSLDQKTRELLDITSKINKNQKILDTVKGQSQTLQGQIKQIDSNIGQVNLSIQSSEVTIDKLGVELNIIKGDISTAEQQVFTKQQAVAQILREVQKGDDETPFLIFLKNKSLADSILETQNLSDLNANLTTAINDLNQAKGVLSDKFQETTGKKQDIQVQKENLKSQQLILGETKSEKQTLLTQSKNQEKVYQQNLTELQKRQADIASEIENMDEKLRLKINPSALPSKRPGVLAWPVGGRVTQDYGSTSFAQYGYRGKWHNGIDLSASIGTPVYSAEKGTVVAVGNSDKYCYKGAYGKFIVIKHENNLTTLYGHLSLQNVKVGDIINRGGLIGYSGKTGYATGPHLHFTVFASQTFRMDSSRVCGLLPYGGDLNPLDYL